MKINKLLILLIVFYTYIFGNSVDVSSRLKVSIDKNGQLTVKSNYMMHYILKTIDKNGNEKKIGIVSPTDGILKSNFNLVDLEYDGNSLFPKGFKFNPSLADFNYKPTEFRLNTYINNWNNTSLKFRGTDITNIDRETFTLFILDALNFAEIAFSTVKGYSDMSRATNKFELYKKLNKVAEYISNYKEISQNASYYISVIKLTAKYLNILMEYAEVGKNDNDPASIQWRFYNATIIRAAEILEKITKTTIKIKPDEKYQMKNYFTLYKQRIKDKINNIDTTQLTIEESIKQLAKVYKKADVTKKEEIINSLFIGLAQEVITLYQQSIINNIKQAHSDKNYDKEKALKKKLLYTSLAKGFLTTIVFVKDYEHIFELAKKEPKIVLNSFLDIAGAVISAYTIKDADTAEAFFKKLTYKVFVKNTSSKLTKNIYKNGNAYMKAVSVGTTIGNRLIPYMWDLFLAPNYLGSSIKNGQLQKFGLQKSEVLIETENGKNYILSNYNENKQEVVIPVEENENIYIYLDAMQEKLFDPTISPWILNSSYVPRTLWDTLISTPKGYSHNFSCVRKVYGDVEYSLHWNNGIEYIAKSGQCGVGEGGFDLDWGSEWYKNTEHSKLYETTEEFPDKYKLLSFSNNIIQDNLNKFVYKYSSNKVETITINFSDIESINTFYKIKLVPKLKNLNFKTDLSHLSKNNLIVSFDTSSISASNEDPIKYYTFNWGDDKESKFYELGHTTHTYEKDGIYTVTLNIVTESGIVYTFKNNVYVMPNTPPVANAGNDITIYEGEVVMLDGSKSYDIDKNDTLTYYWQLQNEDGNYGGDGVFSADGAKVELPITLLSIGQYTFKLTVTDSKGASSSDEVVVTVLKEKEKLTLELTNQTECQSSGKCNFKIGILDNSGLEDAKINFGDGSNLESLGASSAANRDYHYWNINHSYTKTGTYNIVLSSLDDTISKSLNVSVNWQNLDNNLTKGLIAWYKFDDPDDIGKDSSGNGNDGTEYGGVGSVDGIIGKAASFDGVDDYVKVTPQSNVSALSNFTITLWTYFNYRRDNSGYRHYIFDGHSWSKDAPINDLYRDGFYLAYDSDENKEEILSGFNLHNNRNQYSDIYTQYKINDKWIHISFIRKDGKNTIYVNGKLINSSNEAKELINETLDMQHDWFIGTFSGNNNNYHDKRNYSYKGLIDDLRIYNRALNENEIKKLYENGNIKNNIFSYKDNFNEINKDFWKVVRVDGNWKSNTLDYNAVTLENGIIKLYNDRTDDGPVMYSKPIPIKKGDIIIIKRKAYVHTSNRHLNGVLNISSTNKDTLDVNSLNHLCRISHIDETYQGDWNGFYLDDRNNAKAYISPIWDDWFIEEIKYNTRTGEATYTVNGTTVSNVCKVLDNSKNIVIQIHNYGWWTGHYLKMDYIDIKIESYQN